MREAHGPAVTVRGSVTDDLGESDFGGIPGSMVADYGRGTQKNGEEEVELESWDQSEGFCSKAGRVRGENVGPGAGTCTCSVLWADSGCGEGKTVWEGWVRGELPGQ